MVALSIAWWVQWAYVSDGITNLDTVVLGPSPNALEWNDEKVASRYSITW